MTINVSFHQKKREVLMKIEGIQAISVLDEQNPPVGILGLKILEIDSVVYFSGLLSWIG